METIAKDIYLNHFKDRPKDEQSVLSELVGDLVQYDVLFEEETEWHKEQVGIALERMVEPSVSGSDTEGKRD